MALGSSARLSWEKTCPMWLVALDRGSTPGQHGLKMMWCLLATPLCIMRGEQVLSECAVEGNNPIVPFCVNALAA